MRLQPSLHRATGRSMKSTVISMSASFHHNDTIIVSFVKDYYKVFFPLICAGTDTAAEDGTAVQRVAELRGVRVSVGVPASRPGLGDTGAQG